MLCNIKLCDGTSLRGILPMVSLTESIQYSWSCVDSQSTNKYLFFIELLKNLLYTVVELAIKMEECKHQFARDNKVALCEDGPFRFMCHIIHNFANDPVLCLLEAIAYMERVSLCRIKLMEFNVSLILETR
jgi:hypothetical protein